MSFVLGFVLDFVLDLFGVEMLVLSSGRGVSMYPNEMAGLEFGWQSGWNNNEEEEDEGGGDGSSLMGEES